LLDYGEKSFGIVTFLATLSDPRRGASIPLRNISIGAFIMLCTRMGSFNAYEQCRAKGFWRRYHAPGRLPGADQLGRVVAGLDSTAIRCQNNRAYRRLKRRKALCPANHHNMFSLVVDGHEYNSSYRRCCPHCLTRRIKTKNGERIQYYHRLVMAVLVCEQFTLLLDIEMQRKSEGEVRTAQRLLKRILKDYPRAFDLVVADGLYAQGPFFKMVRRCGKHAIAVLKNQDRDLVVDVLGLCAGQPPRTVHAGKARCKVWDIEGLTTWPQAGTDVRVVRSVETTTVKRQTGTIDEQTTNWMWVTTIPQRQLDTQALMAIAHHRWDIENRAFNELATYWYAGHVYKHDINAMTNLWLLTMMAYNLFHVFYFRNLKPAMRQRLAKYLFADCLKSEVLVAQIAMTQRPP